MSEPQRVLIVRLGAMGDIVHALPVLASLRAEWPRAEIDWLVESRHRALLELASGLTSRIVVDTRRILGTGGWCETLGRIRSRRYDMVVDVQGLVKSAVFARATGAAQVVGFDRAHVRESLATACYTTRVNPAGVAHVVDWNLALLRPLGVAHVTRAFPLTVPEPRPEVAAVLSAAGPSFAVVNPGAAWPNKRWPPERFGALATWIARERGWPVFVLWGPGERALAEEVCASASPDVRAAPETSVRDVVAILASAALVVSGDTGPLHIAAALGTPIVGIFGPTDPRRNGPVSSSDITVSRRDSCGCYHLRRCRAPHWCLDDISVEEVQAAVSQRLSPSRVGGV